MGKDDEYFGYYGMLMHQQNMLLDTVRTAAYRDAILENKDAFSGKVVLDVGAGTGILSFFAARAGARKVYAVEASAMAAHAETLAKANGLDDVVTVVRGKIEDVEIPEPVDVVISEPMGVFLLHERMVESYVLARDRFLSWSGTTHAAQMWPSSAAMHVAPFSDAVLHADAGAKAAFWDSADFFGLDLRVLSNAAHTAQFGQTIVGPIDPRVLLSQPTSIGIDFCTVGVKDLQNMTLPFTLKIETVAVMHGLAGWFDVFFFAGGRSAVPLRALSTAPSQPLTHWYQARFLLSEPLAVNPGQCVVGTLELRANAERSCDVFIELHAEFVTSQGQRVVIPGTERTQKCALQDQQYWNLAFDPSCDPSTVRPRH